MSLMTLTFQAFSFAEKCACLVYDPRPIKELKSRGEKALFTSTITILALTTFALAAGVYLCYRKASGHKIVPLDSSEVIPMNFQEAGLLFRERKAMSFPKINDLFSYRIMKQFLFARYINPSAYLLCLILNTINHDREHYNQTCAKAAPPNETQLLAVIEEAGRLATLAHSKAEKDEQEAARLQSNPQQAPTLKQNYYEMARHLFCIPKFN